MVKSFSWSSIFIGAFNELRGSKLRSLLSLLGVTIGIFCIIAVAALIDSLKKNIKDNLSTLGNNVLYINKFAWMPEEGEKEYPFWKYKARPICKLNELVLLKKRLPSLEYGTIMYNTSNEKIKFNNNEFTGVDINAVTYDYKNLQSFEIQDGRYFTMGEMETHSYNIIVGNTIAEELFEKKFNAIGARVVILGKIFTVIGTIKKQGQSITGFNLDKAVILPYKTMLGIQNIEDNGNGFNDNSIMLSPKPTISLAAFKDEIRGAMRAIRKLKPVEENNFSFNELSTVQKQVDGIFVMLNLGGLLIGIFSLLVGAFGISNIMFVSVKERTNIIGIKKALGAKSKIILSEFLAEAVLLCLMGGAMGILMVYGIAVITTKLLDFPVYLSLNNIIYGTSISIIVGLISGIIPARRASKLNPVVAIKS